MATNVRINDELQARIDQQRGSVPRERFVRDLLTQALDAHDRGALPSGRASLSMSRSAPRVASSAAAKASVRPIPKGGEKG